MSRFRNKFIAVCVMAFWLVATQHCGLEAAGMFDDHSGETTGCCNESTGCANDGCAMVEDGSYRPDNNAPAIASPQLSDCVFLICWSITASPEDAPAEISLRSPFERPREWVPTWQFVQRAALSPRAPSFV